MIKRVSAYEYARVLKRNPEPFDRFDGYATREEAIKELLISESSIIDKIYVNLIIDGHYYYQDEYDWWVMGTPSTSTLVKIIKNIAKSNVFFIDLNEEELAELIALRKKHKTSNSRGRNATRARKMFGRTEFVQKQLSGCLDFPGINYERVTCDRFYGRKIREICGITLSERCVDLNGNEVERPAEILRLGKRWE